MTNSAASDLTHSHALGATVLPTSEVVVAAHSDAMVDMLANAPTGDTNHVLCRAHDEPLSDFSRRVEWRLRTLRKKSSIRRVCYLMGPHAAHDWLPCRQVLVTVIALLGSGAVFELVAAPTSSVDVVRTLEELMPYAPVGVQVSIKREEPRSVPEVPERGHVDLARGAASPGVASTQRSGVYYVGGSPS
ncbi:MAG TPA: hypothetical protein VI197_17060 [Polyangiaceae bacterium]